MFLTTKAASRPYHLGTYPLESLPRDPSVALGETLRAPRPRQQRTTVPTGPLAKALRSCLDLFIGNALRTPAPARAPIPDDPHRRMVDVKGYSYFMNASQVGICRLPQSAWCTGAEPIPQHTHAVVLLLAHGRVPEQGNPAREWVQPAVADGADTRIGGIAVCLAGHICQLGWSAAPHVMAAAAVDAQRLAVLAGLAVREQDSDCMRNPYVEAFSLAVVTTDYELAVDEPLAVAALQAKGAAYWFGINGATSGRERNRRAKRATHLGPYPMETVKRVAKPTTLILDGEVPRVSKRAAFFDRALRGDLGAKAQHERNRFAFKQPHTAGMMPSMRSMVPVQDGPVNAAADTSRYRDPVANSRALKSLSYFLGADITGICAAPDYAWFSHGAAGEPIAIKHKYAVIMLIDQEFDTMEGASGDDWISGTQSMRAYLRGAEIAGVMADTLRQLGFPARSQTNADSDVLHIPLMLLAGLGELSRIGELVLNPFLGPRLKTVVMTTDMPLEPDQPIDFGLQYFCQHCTKCARECPCDAISWGPKVMFNGYEMWKPDAERCARYRLTNARGSACGRCMKTCPLNKIVTADGPLAQRAASWCGINAPVLKPLLVPLAVRLDDKLGNGAINEAKKWWFDLEVVDGVCVEPVKGVNRRGLNVEHQVDWEKQKIAYYPAHAMPVPNDLAPQPTDRKSAIAASARLETPAAAQARHARGEPAPPESKPTAPHPDGVQGQDAVKLIYTSPPSGR
ncbi:MAG: Fe-S protein [Gammaproteobacteria bacterium]|nr:Fe-S protein [Gammaproteobacteria bacterium]